MKKLLIFLFTILHFSLSANDKPTVICTVSILEDIAKNLVGNTVNLKMIVPIGGDPHLYEATPRDAQLVRSGDLFFINGLNFEGWIKELIANSGSNAPSVIVSNGVETIGSQTYKNSFDPHAWMNVKNVMIYAKNMKDALVEYFPEHKDIYVSEYEKYLAKLQELHAYVQAEINKIPEQQRILVTSHDAFAYYGKEYGIDVEAILGISTEADARTSDVMRVTNVIKEKNVPAIFIESTINPKMMKRLSEDNGVPVGGELFADSLGEPGTEAGTYLGMIKSNTDVIVGALAQNRISNTKLDDDKGSSKIGFIAVGVIFLLLLIFGIMKMKN